MARRSPDLPEDDGSGRLMPWLIGIMVYLAALSVGTIFTLDNIIQRWNAGLAGTLTIQLPRPADGSPLPAKAVSAAIDLVNATPGVLSAVALDDQAIGKLLQPWLSGGVAPSVLPLPVLIDVRVQSGAIVDDALLEQGLEKLVPGAAIVTRGEWLGNVLRVASMIELTGLVVLGLMGAATVLTVIFTTRTSLLIHREVIDILHMIGARDGYIASRFQWHAFRLAFGGGMVGMLLAGLTLFCLLLASAGWKVSDWGFLPPERALAETVLLVMALPVAAGIVGVFTARLTVMSSLARMP